MITSLGGFKPIEIYLPFLIYLKEEPKYFIIITMVIKKKCILNLKNLFFAISTQDIPSRVLQR